LEERNAKILHFAGDAHQGKVLPGEEVIDHFERRGVGGIDPPD